MFGQWKRQAKQYRAVLDLTFRSLERSQAKAAGRAATIHRLRGELAKRILENLGHVYAVNVRLENRQDQNAELRAALSTAQERIKSESGCSDDLRGELDRARKRLGRAWYTVRVMRALIVQHYEQGLVACDEVIAEAECVEAEGVLWAAGCAEGVGDKIIKVDDDAPSEEIGPDIEAGETITEHPYRPFTTRDGSEGCADCDAPLGQPVHRDPPALSPYEQFAAEVKAAGLTARDCGGGHWQIRGGLWLINVWPETKKGFRMQRQKEKGITGSVKKAIAMAQEIPF